MTLEPFALLCKISKWTCAWRKKTSFDRKAALLLSEKVKLSDETLAARLVVAIGGTLTIKSQYFSSCERTEDKGVWKG